MTLGGRRLAVPKFQGIRFRLGAAMALALFPIILLSAAQSQAQFRREAEERREDLQLAADRSAATAKARLDGAVVLLETLRPESLGLYCAPRLNALVDRLEGYDGLYRFSATGRITCASGTAPGVSALGSTWFRRLRDGEEVVLTRAPAGFSREPALLAAVRAERPMGAFDGAVAAVIPLANLRPDVSDRALPDDTQVALTDAEGRLLTATDPSAFTLADGRTLTGWVERAREDPGALFEARDAEGRRRVYSGAALAGRDVYVLLSAPDPGLWSWARLNPTGAFLAPLLAWAATLLIMLIMSDRIVIRWLDYLERIAAIYARGRFTIRPVQAHNAPSEIRVLARALDEMATTISARDSSLTASLEEKDALMREIHHRVKNNLQIISSLLSMQQRALTDPAARAAVGDTRQRIAALALIYRTLYQGEDIHRADLADFLRELVGQLIASETGRGPLVSSTVEADSLVVDPDKLAPIALWAVEAVTNAQKHAFAGRGGALAVRFRVDGDTSVLEVQDDGPGAEESALSAGVGRTLMTAFARQLRGEVEFVQATEDGGMIARLTFPTPEAQTPVPIDATRGGTGNSASGLA